MADLALAPAPLLLRRRQTGADLPLDPALEIGVGGEARVLGVPGWPYLVAKLYHAPSLARARKLAVMMEAPPTLSFGASLAWPVDLLTDPAGRRFAGFLMPRAEGPRVFEFYNPVSRRRTAPLFDWGRLHRTGANLASAFAALHANGYVVGDVNESNILVSPADASVTLVDTDSFQVRDPVSREVFRSPVGKAEFTPPELQGARFTEFDRGPEHDRFGLAVLLFLLLMEGTHPFASRLEGDGDALPVEDRIRRGMFPHAADANGCRPPRMAPPFFTLADPLQRLFLRAFVAGGADPGARPSAEEWRDALAAAEAGLRECAANPRHRYAPHVPFCPWCHRARLLQGRDPFPATVGEARAADATVAIHRPQRPPAPQPAAPVRAAPFVPAAPGAPPPPLANALTGTLVAIRARVPAWAQPALGPAALGNPLVWMPPAALTCLFAPSGGLRVIGMIVFFLALRDVFRAGVVRVKAQTAAWGAVLFLLWLLVAVGIPLVTGSPARPADADDEDDAVVTMTTPVADPSAPAVAPLTWEESDVDTGPAILNPAEVKAAIVGAYPSELRDAGIGGTAVVRMRVDENGSVDPTSVTVQSASRPEFGFAAGDVAGKIRFAPALKARRPVAVWMTLPVTFEP